MWLPEFLRTFQGPTKLKHAARKRGHKAQATTAAAIEKVQSYFLCWQKLASYLPLKKFCYGWLHRRLLRRYRPQSAVNCSTLWERAAGSPPNTSQVSLNTTCKFMFRIKHFFCRRVSTAVQHSRATACCRSKLAFKLLLQSTWEAFCICLAYCFEQLCVKWYTYTWFAIVFCVFATQLAIISQQLLQLLFWLALSS